MGKLNFFEEKQKKVAEKFGGMKKKYYLCTRLLRTKRLGSYQSGQMGQTVNLLAMPSVVRIHHYPLFPK